MKNRNAYVCLAIMALDGLCGFAGGWRLAEDSVVSYAPLPKRSRWGQSPAQPGEIRRIGADKNGHWEVLV